MDRIDNNKILCDLFRAYYDARKKKRSSFSALFFEKNYETNLFKLHEEILNGKYVISPSVCFVSFKPLQREIFAADFRDRIVHHFIYNYISPIFERLFINDTYSCRIGKGTSGGVKRLNHFIRSCSDNYKKDCYILKLDIRGYFMNIDHSILYKKVEVTLNRYRDKENFDVDLVLRLVRQIIFHDHKKGCYQKGKPEDWVGLPKNKSLFFAEINKGLPIGNLTSQLFGNVYLDEFDHFIKYELGCNYYGRYVDDIVIVHQNKEYLKTIVPLINYYLKNELLLEIHPQKIYLQHHSKGVKFLGAFLKPYRIYIGNQTKGNFYKRIQYWNNLLVVKDFNFDKADLSSFLFSINSYLGIMIQYSTYRLRKKMLTQTILREFLNYVNFSGDYGKININNKEK